MPDPQTQYPPLPPDDPYAQPGLHRSRIVKESSRISGSSATPTPSPSMETTQGPLLRGRHAHPSRWRSRTHRHDFEETFIVLDGEIEATFRGKQTVVHAGQTINIPANAPHRFQNKSANPARLICICSPAGQEKFFLEVGVPVATRTTAPPKLDDQEMAAFLEKAKAPAPKYRTELLKDA